jgi:pentapeptide MXKDX repeat protein
MTRLMIATAAIFCLAGAALAQTTSGMSSNAMSGNTMSASGMSHDTMSNDPISHQTMSNGMTHDTMAAPTKPAKPATTGAGMAPAADTMSHATTGDGM